jgi:hypothetical protein
MTPNPLYNLVQSAIRTIAPSIVTTVLAFLARKYGIVVSETSSADAILVVSSVLFAVYYLAVRIVETYVTPKASVFLADFRAGHTQPVYPDATKTVVVPPAETKAA